ncbi:hypothetical protein ACO2Q8_23940 [Larkinella sp. VNQ87]|uniref:hypothetical protein n=1 Tax=Larkinella sp. VNQ87 TaxID=3400921 RepID=UPI003BFF7482
MIQVTGSEIYKLTTTLKGAALVNSCIFAIFFDFLHHICIFQCYCANGCFFLMAKQTRYNSFDELKDSSLAVEQHPTVAADRYAQFAEAMTVLRKEYIQSKASPDNTTSVSRAAAHGLS